MEKRKAFDEKELPLTFLKEGEIGIVTSIRAGHGKGHRIGRGFERRLMDMGLTPGTEVLVIKSAPFHGPIEVSVRGARLALGRGMAERIFVMRKVDA